MQDEPRYRLTIAIDVYDEEAGSFGDYTPLLHHLYYGDQARVLRCLAAMTAAVARGEFDLDVPESQEDG